MCGIVGQLPLSSQSGRIDPQVLAAMRDEMAHRGPDGVGLWVAPDGTAGLGFRRLAIVDLADSANQPMTNEDGSLWLVFNGEIYNHLDIRGELQRIGGHKWRTDHSDSEVILHAFEQWGIDFVQKLRGMFAIALYDTTEKGLWLIRDRVGIKPLYYSTTSGRFNFASEIKAILRDPRQPRAVDEEALYHYLSFLTTPAPLTLFEGIRKLAGGTWLHVTSDGAITERRYWDALDHAEPLTTSTDEEIAERLLSELRTSVRLRKMSDVPVGVFLSGGVDSSTNVALFSEGEASPVRTFSIGYRGNYPSYRNEFAYAQAVADRFSTDHHEIEIGVDDLLTFLPEMVRLQDEPIADPVCVPVYYVSKLARDNGVVVCQVGEGADELFWGYKSWKSLLQLQRYDDLPVPRAVKRLGATALRLAGKEERREYEFLRRGIGGIPVFWSGAEAFTEVQKRRLLSPALQARLGSISSWDALDPIRRRFERNAWERSPLQWMTYADLNLRLPELLLMRVDKMSMGVSLEGRVPFLDHKVVELAMSLPESVKTRGGVSKYILKKAVRNILPDAIIERPKQGFGVPVYEWFFERLGDRARDELAEFTRRTDFFDPAEVRRIISEGRGADAWYLLNFALWWKEYIGQESTAAIPA